MRAKEDYMEARAIIQLVKYISASRCLLLFSVLRNQTSDEHHGSTLIT